MEDTALALECMKLAVTVSSPTQEDRAGAVADLTTRFYNHIKALSEPPKRGPGRPPKTDNP